MISAKSQYACIALLELATHYESAQPVQVRRIADAHGIPSRFLVQILLQMKAAGLVTSSRGASGGYRLARDPSEITLSDAMSIMDSSANELAPCTGVATNTSSVLLETWNEQLSIQRDFLEGITFADLAANVRERSAEMYYI